MPDILNGLSNADSKAWGYPVLIKSQHVADYCDCEDCEGHNHRTVALPENEWYWQAKSPITYTDTRVHGLVIERRVK